MNLSPPPNISHKAQDTHYIANEPQVSPTRERYLFTFSLKFHLQSAFMFSLIIFPFSRWTWISRCWS